MVPFNVPFNVLLIVSFNVLLIVSFNVLLIVSFNVLLIVPYNVLLIVPFNVLLIIPLENFTFINNAIIYNFTFLSVPQPFSCQTFFSNKNFCSVPFLFII